MNSPPSDEIIWMGDEISLINGKTHSTCEFQKTQNQYQGNLSSYLSCGDPLRAGWSGLGFCGGCGFCCNGGRAPPGPPWPCVVGRGCCVVGARGPPCCCGAGCGASWVGCVPPWVACLVGWPCFCGWALCWGLGPWPAVWGLCAWGELPGPRWMAPCAGGGLWGAADPWLSCRCGAGLGGLVCWAGGSWALGLVTDWGWDGGWPWGEGRCCGGVPWRAVVVLAGACCGPPYTYE